MCCWPLRLQLLRRIRGRGSSSVLLHVSKIITCWHQTREAYNTLLHQLCPLSCIVYPATSSSPLTARSPLTSSSWPLLKRQQKKVGWHSAAPPPVRLTDLLRRPMFSSRHRLERGRKPPKLFLVTLTCLSLLHNRSGPSNSVTWSQYHLLLLLSLSVLVPPMCTRRRLCSSSQWRCTASSPGSVSRPPLVRSLWGLCTPGPSGDGHWKTRSLPHLFIRDALRGNLDLKKKLKR